MPREPYEHERDPAWKDDVARALDDLLGGRPSEDSGRKTGPGPSSYESVFPKCDDCGQHHPQGSGLHLEFSAQMDPAYADLMGMHVKAVGDGVAEHLRAVARAIPDGPKAIEMVILNRTIEAAERALAAAPQLSGNPDDAMVIAHVEYLRSQLTALVALKNALIPLSDTLWTGGKDLNLPGFGGGYADPTDS